MNKQRKFNPDGSLKSRGIEWLECWNADSGYTLNIWDGCDQGCQWEMQDGSKAICYAKTIAVNLRTDKFFPDGFEKIVYHPERIDEMIKHRERAGIFISSMADWMNKAIPSDQIKNFLDVCRQAPQDRIFTLTKNPGRLLEFNGLIPDNVWIGVSMPATYMYGKKLTDDQQYRFLMKSLDVLSQIEATVRWMSFEPLSFDVAPALHEMYLHIPHERWLNWAVVGAASRGKQFYQPDPDHVRRALTVLEWMGCPIFFKGNLDWEPHLEQFPMDALTYTEIDPATKKAKEKVGRDGERFLVSKSLNALGQPIDHFAKRVMSPAYCAWVDACDERKEALRKNPKLDLHAIPEPLWDDENPKTVIVECDPFSYDTA